MSMMLSRKTLGLSAGRRSQVAQPRIVSARAEPRVTQGREYREADNSISMPGASGTSSGSPGPDGGLYADEAAKTMLKPKSNLSAEMKKKLRQEYTSWGGSENKAMSNNYFLWVMGFVAVLAFASHLIGAI